mgnify:CR=1 FL=1
MNFSVFEYLYRDAANWKTYGEALLTGCWSPSLAARIEAALDGDRLFVAEQVGLPALQPVHAANYGSDPDLDHPFHEFVQLRPGTPEDLLGSDPAGSVEAMVEAFRAQRLALSITNRYRTSPFNIRS